MFFHDILSAVGCGSAYPSVDYFDLFRVCFGSMGPPDAVFSSFLVRQISPPFKIRKEAEIS